MRPALSAYLRGAAAVTASQAAGAVAGFLSLWLLARILPKEMLGGYAFAMAAVLLLGHVATLGLDRALLLRIAALPERAGRLHGGGLAARAALAAVLASLPVAAALVASAGPLVRWGAIPEAAFWLPALSATVAPLAVTLVLQAWYGANHRAPVASALPGLADLLRSALLGLVLALGLGAAGVAAAAAVAAAAPAAVLAALALGRTRGSPRRLRAGDFAKGFGFLSLRLSTQGMRQIDLLLMGLLATGALTAEYAVAARLAALADAGRAALKPSYAPRARRWLRLGDRAAAWREYDRSRHAALAAALAATAALALIGPPLLSLFGPFEGAYAPLVLLAAGFVVNAGFGMHASFLAMSGEVGWSAVLRIGALAAFVGLGALLIPRLGGVGAAGAFLATQVLVNVAGAALAHRLTGLRAVDGLVLLVMALAVGAAALVAAGLVPPLAGAALLGAALVLPAARSRDAALSLLRLARERASLLLPTRRP